MVKAKPDPPAGTPDPPPKAPTRCPECSGPLMNILTGAVCMKGCGGLHPLLPPEANYQARREYRVGGLPLCRRHKSLGFLHRADFADCGLYLFDGRPAQFFRRVARNFASLKAVEGNVLARTEGGSVLELTGVKI